MAESSVFQEKMKYWEQLRNAIVHEDNLINHRSTWLITFEGFLIAGVFAIYKGNLLDDAFFVKIIAAIFVMAAILCIVTGYLLLVSYYQISSIRDAWYRQYPERCNNVQRSTAHTLPEFPPIIGEVSKFQEVMSLFKHRWLHMSGLLIIPVILFVIDFLVIFSVV